MHTRLDPMVRPAVAADLPAVEALLTSFDLPTAGVGDRIDDFVVIEDGGVVVASAGLECYGEGALLRSVAVRPEYQRRGLARTLVHNLLSRAERVGVRQVFLLTATAPEYFRRIGFQAIPDTAVDPAVRASKEFGDCCCVEAQTMRLDLGGDR